MTSTTTPTARQREQWARDGFLVVPGLVDTGLTSALRERLAVAEPDLHVGGRLLNAWPRHRAIRLLALEPSVVGLVEALHDRRAVPFQTLDFGAGTEQAPHADSLLFDSLPRGLMCGAWVACEDVGPAQGPLRVWPGSHLLPSPTAEAAGARPDVFDEPAYDRYHRDRVAAIAPVDLTVEEGDVVVWAGDLVHGGAARNDPTRTRWSQVTHYLFEGTCYISPYGSDLDAGRYLARDQLVDIRTRRRAPQRMDGRPVRWRHGRDGRSELVVDPSLGRRAALLAEDTLLRGAPRARRRVAGLASRAGTRLGLTGRHRPR